MNILKLEKADRNAVVYLYQPEGIGDCGEITFSLVNRSATIVKRATEDTPNNRYANKAISKIGEFVQKKNLPMEYTQAWY